MTAAAAADLASARRRLLAEETLTADGPRLRELLTELFESWLARRGVDLGLDDRPGFALIAVGGLARREMLPYSDVDLILLHDGSRTEEVAELADGFWYPLWDARIRLDHSVRTLTEALAVAREDVSAALGMLEARHIVGDEDLAELLIGGVRQQWRTEIRHRFPEVVAHARERWRRSGEVAHRAEPDLKNGRGGLRDVQLLNALAIAQVTDATAGLRLSAPGGGPAEAYDRLLDIRTRLHLVAGRARDQVQAQDADEIGAALGLGDRFEVSRAISAAARTITYSVDLGLRTAANSLPRRGLSRLRRAPLRRPLDEGIVEHGGEIVLARTAVPGRDPGLMLRVASVAARTGLPISSATLSRLADYAPPLPEPWPPEALDDLLVLLSSGSHLIDPIEALDRTGLWARLLPEWDLVRDLPPRDPVHIWTVDRHLMETAAQAGPLATSVSRPDLLVLGALLHDLGKGLDGDHSIVGAELAGTIGRRIGLWPHDIRLLAALVRHHLLLPRVATRRDIADPRTIEAVFIALDGDPQLLELLAALAEADGRATGPGVWNEWKAALIGELVVRVGARMAGETAAAPPEPLTDEQRELAEAGGYAVRFGPDRRGHAVDAIITAPDQPGLLSKMAGVLAMNDLRVRSATVAGHAGQAVNTFEVVPAFGNPPDAGLVRQQLVAAVEGRLDPLARLVERHGGAPLPTARRIGHGPDPAVPALFAVAPPRLRWLDTGDELLLELRAADFPGLLAKVTAVLEECGVNVTRALVDTLGSTVVDTFAVELPTTGRQGRTRVATAVLEVCGPVLVRPDEDDTDPPPAAPGSRAGVPIG